MGKSVKNFCAGVRLIPAEKMRLTFKMTCYTKLKILNFDGLWENKRFSDKNQRFDWVR